MFSKKDPDVLADRKDTLIVLADNKTADIAAVISQREDAVHAVSPDQSYTVPLADLQYYVGTAGRVYVYSAPMESVQTTKNLAALEKSIVLEQITNFMDREPEDQQKLSIRDLIMYAVMFILLLAVVFK